MRTLPLALVTILALAGPAAAQPSPAAQQAFAEGETAFRLGRYSEAITAFENAYRLSNAPKLLYNIAQSYRKRFEVQGDPIDLRRARELYQSYLQLDPATNRRAEVVALLAEIEARLRDPTVSVALPLLEHEPPGPIVAGTPLQLPVTVSRDPSHRVATVVVRYRRGAQGELREAAAVVGQPIRISAVSLPAAGAPYQLEYFLEGRAADGTPLTTLGSASEPFTLDVQAVPARSAGAGRDGHRRTRARSSGGSIFGKWWFWTLTGVVLAGAGAATYVVVSSDTTPDSELGTIDLR